MKKPKKKFAKGPERLLQEACVKWLILQNPTGLWWTAINPSPSKTIHVAKACKAMGMKAGVPDLEFIYKGIPFFVELKATKGVLSEDQKRQIQELMSQGVTVLTAKDLDEFIGCVVWCMGRIAQLSRIEIKET